MFHALQCKDNGQWDDILFTVWSIFLLLHSGKNMNNIAALVVKEEHLNSVLGYIMSSKAPSGAEEQDHPDSPSQKAPRPANKASVHQIPVTSEQSLHCIERINGDTHLLSLP